MSRLVSRPSRAHGLQIAHVTAWRRHVAGRVRVLWNEGVSMREICARLYVDENFIDRVVRGLVCVGVGPEVRPRRAFGRGQKQKLREQVEVPG